MANRSGAGVEAAGMLQPAVIIKMSNVKMDLVLIMFGLNGFKVALLAGQNFCAYAPAIGTGYFFINRVNPTRNNSLITQLQVRGKIQDALIEAIKK